jgi:hypothetical protein
MTNTTPANTPATLTLTAAERAEMTHHYIGEMLTELRRHAEGSPARRQILKNILDANAELPIGY